MEIRAVTAEADVVHARRLFLEYAQSLPVDLEDVGFSREVAALPAPYRAPTGVLLLARDGARMLGCAGVRALEPGRIAELKRLFVRPEARGQGVAERLVRDAMAFAAGAGYAVLRLDTLPTMAAAQRLYERLGFQEIAPYAPVTWPGMRFMEVTLRPTEGAGADALQR